MIRSIIIKALVSLLIIFSLTGCEFLDSLNSSTDSGTSSSISKKVDTTSKEKTTTKVTEQIVPLEYKDGHLDITNIPYNDVENTITKADTNRVYIHATIVDSTNCLMTIKDKEGNDYTVQFTTQNDIRAYNGTEVDVYGFCTGGISSQHKTRLFDLSGDNKDNHFEFYDGKKLYPNDFDSCNQYPKWQFEQQNTGTSYTVWIPTQGGTKYHSRSNCSKMENPRQVTEKEAIAMGYGKCGKCW